MIKDVTPIPQTDVDHQREEECNYITSIRRCKDMARYTGASCRQCRREGMKLFLKG